jgi:hypothetical protein
MENWADDLGAVAEARKRANVATLHNGSIIQSLW